MVLLTSAAGLVAGLALSTPQAAPNPPPPPASVEQVESRGCGFGTCHRLRVRCADLPPRIAHLRETPPSEGTSQGTVVFTTGVWGNKPYLDQPERRATLEAAREAGFEVFELWWDGRRGWGEDAEGAGFTRTFCGYGEVVRWLLEHRADRPTRVCAQGNSGGALQIAYGLTFYGLGDVLDLAVLSGGPPLVDIAGFCFDRTRERSKMWRENGRRITDTVFGFDDAGDFCKNGDDTPEARATLEHDSLVRPRSNTQVASTPAEGPERSFDFPTRVVFVQSQGDKSTRQARHYFDALTGPKEWHPLDSRAHGVDRTAETAGALRQILLERCSSVGE